MLLAIWILADVALRVQDLAALYTDEGAVPSEAILAHYPPALTIWSFFLLARSPLAQGFVFLLQAVCAGLLLVGFRTRLMTCLSWMFLVSLDARNPLVTQGWDTLTQLMLFWSMFVPLGAAFSVDRALTPPGHGPEPDETWIFSTSTIAILSQILFLYVFAGLHKYQSPVWQDGSAVFKALSAPDLRRAPGTLLVGFPRLLEVMTYAVLWFEIFGPFLLFSPVFHSRLRALAVLCFVGLQVGLGSCINLSLFPFISSLSMVLFIPGAFWDRYPALQRRLSKLYAGCLARPFSRFAPGIAAFHLGPVQRVLVAFLVLYVAVWNMLTLDRPFLEATARRTVPLQGRGYRPPHPVQWLGFMLRLNQAMTMFVAQDGASEWHVVRIDLADGTHREFFLDGASLVDAQPDPHARFSLFRARWRDFWWALPGYPWAHTHAGAYVCRRFRREHPQTPAYQGLSIYRVRQRLLTDPAGARLKRFILIGHLCEAEDGELEP